MIQEAYCSYEVAKLLKEKGFNENTICKYADIGGITEKWYDDYRERVLRFDWNEGYLIEPLTEPKDQYEIIGDTISAPTHQMAMSWLREVHGIFIAINNDDLDFNWQCYDLINRGSTLDPKILSESYAGYKTYEEAVEAALKYCLENLI